MASYGIPSDQSARLYFKATGTNSATSNDINTLANNLDVNKIQVDRANRTAQGFPPTPLTRKEFDQYFYGGDKEHYIKIEGGNQNFVGKMANIEKLWTQFSNDPNGAQKLQDINKPATVNPSVAQYMKVLSSMSGSKDYYGSIPDAQKGYIIDA